VSDETGARSARRYGVNCRVDHTERVSFIAKDCRAEELRERSLTALTNPSARRRAVYFALALVTIDIGLFEHRHLGALGHWLGDALGDAMWAAMMVWIVSVLAPDTRRWIRYGIAYAICAAVETSQAYHTPVLMTLRSTTLGYLVFGSGFDPRDFFAYAFGVVVAALIDAWVVRRVQLS